MKLTMLENASKIRTEKFQNLMDQLYKLKQNSTYSAEWKADDMNS